MIFSYTALTSGCVAIRENSINVEVYHDEIWLKEIIPCIVYTLLIYYYYFYYYYMLFLQHTSTILLLLLLLPHTWRVRPDKPCYKRSSLDCKLLKYMYHCNIMTLQMFSVFYAQFWFILGTPCIPSLLRKKIKCIPP